MTHLAAKRILADASPQLREMNGTAATDETTVRQLQRLLTVAIAFAALLFTFVAPLSAQEGGAESSANLSETISWLKSTINNQDPVPRKDAKYKLAMIGVENGVLQYKETFTAASGTYKNGKTTYFVLTSVPLAAVDPMTVETVQNDDRSWRVRFKTSFGKRVISQKSDIAEEDGRTMNNNGMEFNDKSIAVRLSRALKHAVTLAGGQIDPF